MNLLIESLKQVLAVFNQQCDDMDYFVNKNKLVEVSDLGVRDVCDLEDLSVITVTDNRLILKFEGESLDLHLTPHGVEA
ncbi:hypothetical protein [Caloranaerobacter sp. DY30410]|uniref:hypothetical protein n=1 Tax=Caloranaerobacter sp. DY30410 TaxID=3238305 RepID=UPI003D023E03